MSIHYLTHCPPNPTKKFADSIRVPKGTTHLVSQGGGSTIDVGKWVARKYKLHHRAVPTTAGTGSEVTPYVVLTVNGKKKTFTDDAFIPDEYDLRPELVTSLPYLHTLSSGFDALSQSFEALWSKNATMESTLYAYTSIVLIKDNLPLSLKEPKNKTCRGNMLLAAHLSGQAITITKTNACHAFSYPLTDWYGIPHGLACAHTLVYFTKLALGIDLKLWMSQFDIPKYDIDWNKVAKLAINSEKLKDFPQEIEIEDLLSSDLLHNNSGAH